MLDVIKKRISVRRVCHSLVQCITNLAAESIKEATENKKDEVMLREIHCMDLVAREA